VAAVLIAGSTPLTAQTEPDPFLDARHRRGPVAVDPELSLVDVGIDTNVFNEVTEPKRDFTASARPAADVWLRMGRVRLDGRAQVAFNFFREYASERSVDTANRAHVEFRTARVSPFATASIVSARDRVSPEIDVRIRRGERTIGGGFDIYVGPRTTLRLATTRFRNEYTDQVASGSFSEALDRTETQVAGALRYRLTPLTTLVGQVERQRNRFDFATTRDADTLTVTPGVEFARAALIAGRSFVGYRRFDFRDPRLTDYRGLVASVELSYVLRGTTQFGFSTDRNVEYSFDIAQPYYLSSGSAVSVTQQVNDRLSVMGQVGRRQLDYRAPLPGLSVAPRVDSLLYLGSTIGIRLSPRTRLDLTAFYQQRTSIQRAREYDGLRVGSAFFYEF
jgi:hypothetical protein